MSDNESQSHWQQKDYKSFNPSIDWSTVDWSSSYAIQQTPVTSAIVSPSHNDKISVYDDEISISGYAFAGGGRDIIRVDVSSDNGKTWHNAKLHKELQYKYNDNDKFKRLDRQYAWTQWSVTLPVELTKQDNVQLICKAVDSHYNVQPDTVAPIWNLRGVLNNAWHRVNLKVDKHESSDNKVATATATAVPLSNTNQKQNNKQ